MIEFAITGRTHGDPESYAESAEVPPMSYGSG